MIFDYSIIYQDLILLDYFSVIEQQLEFCNTSNIYEIDQNIFKKAGVFIIINLCKFFF
ncbi:hypothetical protein pb186bvf_020553 [Paramecium bursaria]